MLSQGKYGGHDLGDCRQAEVGLLKTDAAGLEKNNSAGRCAPLAVGTGQIESGSHFFARHLAHASTLERTLERYNHRRLPRDFSLHHYTAVVFLRGYVLNGEPGRLDAIKRTKQFPRCSHIEESCGTSAGVELKKTLPVEKARSVSRGDHCSLSSTACSRRSMTLPGVPPASLI